MYQNDRSKQKTICQLNISRYLIKLFSVKVQKQLISSNFSIFSIRALQNEYIK